MSTYSQVYKRVYKYLNISYIYNVVKYLGTEASIYTPYEYVESTVQLFLWDGEM